MERRSLRNSNFVAVAFVAVALLTMVVGGNAIVEAVDSDTEPLLIDLAQFVVIPTEEDGEEQLVPLEEDAWHPAGTIVEYALTVKNVSEKDVGDLVLGLLVPHGTEYIEGSERYDRDGALLQFSIDGGDTFRNPPVKYVVKLDDGTEVEKVATADMYTDLRLVFLRAISSDEEVGATYRVVVR